MAEQNATFLVLPPRSTQVLSKPLTEELTLWLASLIISISPFGIIGNILNIYVFHKLGLSTSTNLNFFCLAIADLFSIVWIVLKVLAGVLPMFNLSLILDMHGITSVMGPLFFSCSAFASWVTTIISLERSCCIVFPMKVKLIFTRRTVTAMLSAMLLYQVVTSVPFYFTVGVVFLKNPLTNWTTIKLQPSKDPELASLSHTISYSFPTSICFVLVVIATTFLISNFKRSRKLRRSMTGSAADASKDKDIKLINSVIIVCVVYIIGYFLSVVLFLCDLVGISFVFYDPYLGNLSRVLFQISFFFQVLSCSVNIVVYYRMNSSYRSTLKNLAKCCFPNKKPS